MLGVAYKNDVGDTRESPALDIMGLLQGRGAEVVYSDPHVPSFRSEGRTHSSQPLTDEELQKADCVIVTCRHDEFDFDQVARHARVVVDTRNAFPRNAHQNGSARIIRL